MIKELNDVSIRTMIGQLPDIINKNNNIIKENFDNIYDSTLNKIIKSVDTTQNNNDGNYVKSQTGNFLNIICDNIVANKITVNDITIDDDDEISNHDKLSNRFKDLNGNNIIINNTNDLRKYSHNACAIGFQLNSDSDVISLQQVLIDLINQTNLNGSIYGVKVNNMNYSSSKINESSDELLTEPKSFTFDNNVLFASTLQLKRMNLPEYQYNDIKSGNLFTYYEYNNIITINDEHTASLTGNPGQKVKIKFNDLKKKAYFRIILSRKDKKYLRISKDELLRLNLICESTDDVYGTIWDVDTYCVRHPEDLIIETK